MSAYTEESTDIVIDDMHIFNSRVGIIHFAIEFKQFGIEHDSVVAMYREDRIDELIKLCEEHPEYHILTITSDWEKTNRYLPGFGFYRIGKGDNNPNLVLNVLLNTTEELFMERMNKKLRSIFRKMKYSNNFLGVAFLDP